MSRAQSSRRYNKFTFSDYRFAAFVRARMVDVLSHFDANNNQMFQQQQIKQFLVQVLHEDPNELYYVVQNVFRYDRDNDGKITLKEFIDFSVEHHFGQMAIQRLHRQKLYSQGSKRLMNLGEFIHTMEFSLNPIEVSGSEEIYQLLFSEVDLDKDGYISYEDYFVFLKEYFGSLSAIYDDDPLLKPHPDPAPNTNPDFSIDNRATQRFAKLIYSQLKITVMQFDQGKKLSLNGLQVRRFLEEALQMNEAERQYIANNVLQGQDRIAYDAFLQFIVPFHFCDYYPSAVGLENASIDLNNFVALTTKASSIIVAVPPSQKTLMSIFYLATGANGSQMDHHQYVMLMSTIFDNFSFDKRGLARGAAH